MTTARDIVTSALRKIHVAGIGAPLASEEAAQAFDTLNDMMASLSAEGASIYQESLETFSLISGQISYTIGSGLDFNTTAPLYITAAYIRQSNTDYPLAEYDEKQYSRISRKDLTAAFPDIYYYDANYPTSRLYLYPAPSASDTITISSRKPLTNFTTLDTVFAFPEQYKAMLIHNLAVWIAPEYEREASRTIERIARSSKKAVMAQNKRNEKKISIISGVPSRGRGASFSDFMSGRYYR